MLVESLDNGSPIPIMAFHFLSSSDMLEADLSNLPLIFQKMPVDNKLGYLEVEPGMDSNNSARGK